MSRILGRVVIVGDVDNVIFHNFVQLPCFESVNMYVRERLHERSGSLARVVMLPGMINE